MEATSKSDSRAQIVFHVRLLTKQERRVHLKKRWGGEKIGYTDETTQHEKSGKELSVIIKGKRGRVIMHISWKRETG